MPASAAPHSLVSLAVVEAMLKVARACPDGAFVEVGVYHGGTAWHLAHAAEEQRRPIWLYDTFTGIPYRDAIDSHQVGDFSDTSFRTVEKAIPYAQVVPGLFPGSAHVMGPIAFVHLDVDQYRSYKEALAFFRTRMVRGGVIWCDDADCLEGAGAAVREFAQATGLPTVKAEKIYIQF